MSAYLVTGSAGFIAFRVCEQLLQEGHTVVGIDNFCPDYDLRMKDWRIQHLRQYSGFDFHRGDIAEINDIHPLFEENKFSGVINLAARAGVRASVEDPWAFVNTNTVGTLNLLESCKEFGVKKFVLASTSSVYGENAPLPTPETAESSLPLQPYAASKKAAEAMCHAYHFLHGIDVTVFRYFTVYGPGGRPNQAMFRFVQWIAEGKPLQLFGDGEQTRGFTYLDDIARGTILGLKPVGYEIINLGGHEVVTVNELIALMEEKIGKKAQINRIDAYKADMRANHANVTKAKSILGWQAEVSLEEGVQRLIDWYFEEHDWTPLVETV